MREPSCESIRPLALGATRKIVHVMTTSRRGSLCHVSIVLLAAVACGGGAERAQREESTGAQRNPPGATSAATRPADSVVTERGLGPLRAGMTIADAVAALGGALSVPVEYDSTECDYAVWRGGPRGVHVMIDQGRIARIEVDSAGVATAQGVQVGDTEERIQQLYSGRVKVTPHKYEEGHYLTVNAVGDSSLAIVFETSKGRVTRYRAGRRPAVEYVEGCS
jgi:hypothetical protein